MKKTVHPPLLHVSTQKLWRILNSSYNLVKNPSKTLPMVFSRFLATILVPAENTRHEEFPEHIPVYEIIHCNANKGRHQRVRSKVLHRLTWD
jgi:hypothetical protein